MKNILLINLLFFVLSLTSCKKECQCDKVIYESNNQNNYTWSEVSRIDIDVCEEDSMFSTYLDSLGYISHVSTFVECE